MRRWGVGGWGLGGWGMGWTKDDNDRVELSNGSARFMAREGGAWQSVRRARRARGEGTLFKGKGEGGAYIVG